MNVLYLALRSRAGPAAACLALSILSLTAAAQTAGRRIVLPAGTVIPVRLVEDISSKTAQTGDRFVTTVRAGQDDAGLPVGSTLEGAVRESVRAENGKPGMLDMDFNRVVFPNGDSRSLRGSLISLNGKDIQRSSSGRLVASADKGKDRLKWIGIGAGAGLLLGTVTKGNALMDALLGAGAGYLYNEFGNKPKAGDVDLKSGTEFGVRLDSQLAFYSDRNQYSDASWSTPSAASNYGQPRYYRAGGKAAAIRMLIDDRSVDFGSAQPYMRDSHLLVPIAAISRAANLGYRYDSQQRVIYAANDALTMGLNSRTAVRNGERIEMPIAAEMRNGTLFVPVQFVSLATGGSMHWDAATRTINLVTDRGR